MIRFLLHNVGLFLTVDECDSSTMQTNTCCFKTRRPIALPQTPNEMSFQPPKYRVPSIIFSKSQHACPLFPHEYYIQLLKFPLPSHSFANANYEAPYHVIFYYVMSLCAVYSWDHLFNRRLRDWLYWPLILCFSSVRLHKWHNSTSSEVTAASFHILSSSLFTVNPATRCHMMWAT